MTRFNFRVWIGKNTFYPKFEKIMKYEDFVIENDGEIFFRTKECSFGKDCVLMQSTGFFDNNGKEIFEGDILENKDCSDSRVKVVFLFPSNINGNRFGFYLENLETYSVKDFLNPDIDLKKLEVIGNIYE